MPAAFHFDPNRCTGCRACELACSIENDLGAERSWRHVVTFNDDQVAGVPRYHLSLACNHCADPACMYACPALAYSRDPTGAVLLDPDRCIGCRYCAWACPYGAPTFEEDTGVMGKCTFCSHRLARGLKPACATLCPTGALDFADLPAADLTSRVAGFPQTGLGPSIRIETPRRSAHLHAAVPVAGGPPSTAPLPVTPVGIGLRSEWSLAAFTFLVALLFACYVGTAGGSLTLSAIVFAAGAVLAAGFSLAHLGRPHRAWRAGLNLRRSWLSREVAGFGCFVAGGVAALATGTPLASGPGIAVAGIGLLTLASADQVYRPVYPGLHPVLDGGGSLLTGLYLGGLLLGSPWVAGPIGFIKAASLAFGARRPAALVIPHAALGLALPAAVWLALGVPLPYWVIFCAVVGEALGRAGFYQRLRVLSPALQVRADLLRPSAPTDVRRAS